jgi:hypothetical protein
MKCGTVGRMIEYPYVDYPKALKTDAQNSYIILVCYAFVAALQKPQKASSFNGAASAVCRILRSLRKGFYKTTELI